MPNEILNIQHTITQLQHVEKVQAIGQQREQYQQKQEVLQLQEKKELEQTVVQISEEAEKVFLKEEGDKRNKEGRKGSGRKKDDPLILESEPPDGERREESIDIVV